MRYIDAKRLIDLCLEEDLFNLHEGKILLFRNIKDSGKTGWYITEKEDVIHLIKNDTEGQSVLINALEDKGINFKVN